MKKYISAVEMNAVGIDKSKYTRITKKYALADFYENNYGELITASDDMNEIKKSAEKFRRDTDGECLLFGLQWNDEADGYEKKWNL